MPGAGLSVHLNDKRTGSSCVAEWSMGMFWGKRRRRRRRRSEREEGRKKELRGRSVLFCFVLQS